MVKLSDSVLKTTEERPDVVFIIYESVLWAKIVVYTFVIGVTLWASFKHHGAISIFAAIYFYILIKAIFKAVRYYKRGRFKKNKSN